MFNNLLTNLSLYFAKPNSQSYLKVDTDHEIYVESWGNPKGECFIYLHGGPGGDVDKSNLRWFNLKKHHVVLFEQRACNRSRGDFYTNNTTWDMVEDINKIKEHFNINNFNLFGGSWGSCLALAYAIKYPTNVKNLYLWGLLLGNKADTTFLPEELLSPEEKFFCEHLFFFEEDDWILKNCSSLKEININLAHGKKDVVCNYTNATKLKEKLPHINLYIEEEGYHSSHSPGIEKFLKEQIKI